MPIFISYSHTDSDFVNRLAAHLVKLNTHVWVDTWELNVGDSILEKVQQAIQESSALLVVLSKASVVSEWCKKELSAGLMRELDEKRVIVLPVLLDNCAIPIFLRDKMYADFRLDFDAGLKALVNAVARVTAMGQGRIETGNSEIDWAEDWGYEGDRFVVTYTLIESSRQWPFTLLTEVQLKCNDVVTRRYKEFEAAGLDWLGRMVLTETLVELANAKEVRLLLEDQYVQTFRGTVQDSKIGAKYDVFVKSRRLGEENGKDQLVNVTNYLRNIRDYIRTVAREPTREETAKLVSLIKKGW